jgi:hypothetical protein
VDWTGLETFSRPPSAKGGPCADPEASWGHRKNNLLRSEDELFYGYCFSAGTMAREENGPDVPELARRAAVSSCRHDLVRAFAPVLTAMPGQGIPLGDVLDDCGHSHRDAGAWAIPLRNAGAQLVQDLHPHDRGPKGTHDGAIISNGNLYCPKTPRPLPEIAPLARTATKDQAADWERKTAELARHKLGRLTADDADGYHRVQCPAAMGKIRCPLRPASMRLDRDRPEILHPPEHPPARCAQQTITVPPEVNAKTAQKHDYPSAAWRRSYARRTGAERGFATAKDPAASDISRGWCRLMGLAPLMLFVTTLLVVRNQRILAAWNTRQEENSRRAAPQNPQTAPQDPRRPHRRAALTRNHYPTSPAKPVTASQDNQPQPGESISRNRTNQRTRPRYGTRDPSAGPWPAKRWNVRPKRETRPHRNVKTSLCSGTGSNYRPSAFQRKICPFCPPEPRSASALVCLHYGWSELTRAILAVVPRCAEKCRIVCGYLVGNAPETRTCGNHVGVFCLRNPEIGVDPTTPSGGSGITQNWRPACRGAQG